MEGAKLGERALLWRGVAVPSVERSGLALGASSSHGVFFSVAGVYAGDAEWSATGSLVVRTQRQFYLRR